MITRPLLTALLLATTALVASACNANDSDVNRRRPGDALPETNKAADNDTETDEDSPLVVGEEDEDGWIILFNGEDLTGWTPKFSGYELGDNFRDTFQVVDGNLVVSYENWEDFGGQFGHLFFTGGQTEYSHYILKLEYRFTGEQVPGGPGWAWRNNGIMFHGQPADTMGLDQDFPASIEAQMLGAPGSVDDENPANRATANVCTPGTHIHKDGQLTRAHVINFDGPSFPGDQWVTFEIEVHGSQRVIHRINGEVVAEYGPLVLDENDNNMGGKAEAERRGTTVLGSGTISLQAESHNTEFRNIRLKVLVEDDE